MQDPHPTDLGVRYTVILERTLGYQDWHDRHGGSGVKAAKQVAAHLNDDLSGWNIEVVARKIEGPHRLPLAELGPDVDANRINYQDDPT